MNPVHAANDAPQKDASSPLAGKTILVTGGGSGLGAALCHTLAGAGANIMVGDRNRDSALAVAETLTATKGAAHAIQFDVGEPTGAAQAIAHTIDQFGTLDVLINNAGVDVTCPLEELAYADWDRIIRTNLYGPFLLSQCAARHMKQQRRGHIINIASTAAKRTWPNASAYHASKWGLLGFSHALHAELRPHNIKVTAVVAGGMRTPFLLDRFPEIDLTTLQDPLNVARTVQAVLTLPDDTVVAEITVLPLHETSWP